MKKHLLLGLLFSASSANASLTFTNVSYTASSVTFTVDGDMNGYTAPLKHDNQFSLIYGGDIWSASSTGFSSHSWSQTVFDNKSFILAGSTGSTGSTGDGYSWSRHHSSLDDATVSSATITLSMSESQSPLDIDAINPIIDFVWGNGSENTTLLQSVEPSSVPIPAATWLFGSGLVALIGMRREKKPF